MVLWSQNHLLVETYMKTFLVFITSNKANLINREDFQVGKYYLHRKKKLDQLQKCSKELEPVKTGSKTNFGTGTEEPEPMRSLI